LHNVCMQMQIGFLSRNLQNPQLLFQQRQFRKSWCLSHLKRGISNIQLLLDWGLWQIFGNQWKVVILIAANVVHVYSSSTLKKRAEEEESCSVQWVEEVKKKKNLPFEWRRAFHRECWRRLQTLHFLFEQGSALRISPLHVFLVRPSVQTWKQRKDEFGFVFPILWRKKQKSAT
jgi:hypothetical protein